MRLEQQLRDAVDRLELPFNSLGVDPYGISKKHLITLFTGLAAFYRWYFTVRTRGIEHVPTRGRAILVGNHSGGAPIDAAMVAVSCLLEMRPPRLAHAMAHKFINRLPVLSQWAGRSGQFTGLRENAERLLEDERLLLVFPEGEHGVGKLFRERYSLVKFPSGFMRVALKMRAPIVPFAFLGAGEAYPTVANSRRLGRALGIPFFPIAAYGLPLPLPVNMEIVYAPPMRFSGTGEEDERKIRGYVEEVKAVIARMIDVERRRRRTRGDEHQAERS